MTQLAERDWDEENAALLALAQPRPCPRCGRTGFYGPRRASPKEKYHACSFCGFWQAVGEEPTTAQAWAHGCDAWPPVAGAPLVAWAPPGATEAACPACGRRAQIASHRVKAPAAEPKHAWWRVRQGMSALESLVYWRAQLESRLPLFSRLYL